MAHKTTVVLDDSDFVFLRSIGRTVVGGIRALISKNAPTNDQGPTLYPIRSERPSAFYRLRFILDMTQRDFSELIGVPQSLVSEWERRVSYPCEETLTQILAALPKRIDKQVFLEELQREIEGS